MSSSTSSEGVVDRVQAFVSENKRVVLVGAALTVAAIGGFAYYASTSRRPGEGDTEKGERKKKSKSKKPKSSKDGEEPLLEETASKAGETAEAGTGYMSYLTHSRTYANTPSAQRKSRSLKSRSLLCPQRYVCTG